MEREVSNKEYRAVVVGGARRGAELMQPAIQMFNEDSQRFAIAPLYVDPYPRRAMELAVRARENGIPALAAEARVEEMLQKAGENELAPLVLHVDRPLVVATALRAATNRSVLGYMLLRMPTGELYGMRMVLCSYETELKHLGAQFFEGLGEVTARSGTSFIVGEQGRPEHLVVEPVYREWFASHMKINLAKLVAGLEPESNPFEVTPDGRRVLPLHIWDSRSGWEAPLALTARITSKPVFPVIRGGEFAVGEIGPDGVRIHRLRFRQTDGKLTLYGMILVDVANVKAAEEQERTRRELERVLRRNTISRMQPVFTTD